MTERRRFNRRSSSRRHDAATSALTPSWGANGRLAALPPLSAARALIHAHVATPKGAKRKKQQTSNLPRGKKSTLPSF